MRASPTIAWWRALRASTVDVKSNLILREARRPRRLARVRMGSLYGNNRLIGFFFIYPCYDIDQPGSGGWLLVYLPSISGANVSDYNV